MFDHRSRRCASRPYNGLRLIPAITCAFALILPDAATATPPQKAAVIFESFETGLGPWAFDSHIWFGGNLPFDPSIVPSTAQAHDAQWSLAFSAIGHNDDGSLWIERSVDLPAGKHDISLSFQQWSESAGEFGTWEVLAFIDAYNPELQDDFRPPIGTTNMTAGWHHFQKQRSIVLDKPGRVWIALGLRVSFEDDIRTYYYDSATITIATTPPPSCPGDTNGDNAVNGADLSVLLSQFGLGVDPGSGADLNADGIVNGADLSVLLARFGVTC